MSPESGDPGRFHACGAASDDDNVLLGLGRFQGPDWLTGGAFGIESSLPLLAGLLLTTVLLYAWIIRHGPVVRPRWGRPHPAAQVAR